MSFPRHVVLLGATGSIGGSAAEVARTLPEQMKIIGLSGNNNSERLLELAREFHPDAISTQNSTTAEQLQGFRGLSKGETKPPHSDRILNAVKRGQESEDEIPTEIKRRSVLQPSGEENLGLDLLRVCITLLSNEFHIAGKHIVSPQNLLPLLRLKPKSIEELEASELVSPQLGEKGIKGLFAFLTGNSSLRMSMKKSVELYELPELDRHHSIQD